jgi:hypothetical protein
MTHIKLCKQLTICVEKKDKKYQLLGLYFEGTPLIEEWEDIAIFLVYLSTFSKKDMDKNTLYNIVDISIKRVEKQQEHFLKLTIQDYETLYLDHIEVKLIQAIANRVLARCDLLLERNVFYFQEDNYSIFEKKD